MLTLFWCVGRREQRSSVVVAISPSAGGRFFLHLPKIFSWIKSVFAQGLVDAILGCRNDEKENFVCCNNFVVLFCDGFRCR